MTPTEPQQLDSLRAELTEAESGFESITAMSYAGADPARVSRARDDLSAHCDELREQIAALTGER